MSVGRGRLRPTARRKATTLPDFDSYDSELADIIRTGGLHEGGLPGYLGIRLVDIGPGVLTAELDVREELLNPFGTAHGGVLASLVDHVLGAVLYPLIPRGTWAATTEFKVNLLAPVRSGALVARAEVLSLTRRTAVVRIDATNEGRLVGAAQGTVSIRPPKPAEGPVS